MNFAAMQSYLLMQVLAHRSPLRNLLRKRNGAPICSWRAVFDGAKRVHRCRRGRRRQRTTALSRVRASESARARQGQRSSPVQSRVCERDSATCALSHGPRDAGRESAESRENKRIRHFLPKQQGCINFSFKIAAFCTANTALLSSRLLADTGVTAQHNMRIVSLRILISHRMKL